MEDFKFHFEKIKSIEEEKVKKLTYKLKNDLEDNKEYIGSKQVDYVYKHKKSKKIIDEINTLVSDLFNLKKEEIYSKNLNFLWFNFFHFSFYFHFLSLSLTYSSRFSL